ncbi:RTA1 like protein-domain-containing protein [Fusarium flagelliforme]|uniref:Rta1 like protein family n=1 Tax=Fusarium flagelliforme TaxID=2675880 RepID=A0A395MYV1_9HYPO|nr:RTA1 like protein-domain-containing protein [Fusarium flagelliforme]KAH7188323.1 RTA1 like protein-domain-containing protein [Fusarium flagelliforme]RFN52917.1 rta1 like protein family [Fusarium flagelliforme]
MPYNMSISPEDAFGPDSPCNLDTCPIDYSLYGYRPSLAANIVFVVLFSLIGFVHVYLGFRWKSWGFMTGMLLGCISEVIGYVGRIMMYYNPFSFNAFMIQIVCLTIAPVFYTASIYVTLSKAINYFSPELSRFKPQLFIWIFIPFDIVCLILQAAGGAMSTESDSQVGVDVSMAGLVLQVVVLVAFIAAFSDYMIRYWRSGQAQSFNWRMIAFFLGLSASIILILTRCIYRVAELREGYDGDLIKHEIPFIILEGAVIVLAAVALCFGHPGLVFNKSEVTNSVSQVEKGVTSGSDN